MLATSLSTPREKKSSGNNTIQIRVYQLTQVSQLLAKAHGRCAMAMLARTRSTSAVNNVFFPIMHRTYLFVNLLINLLIDSVSSSKKVTVAVRAILSVSSKLR